ncbi:MAG: MerR family transcriptional regulator [Pseudomonadota bacterium]
MNLYKISEVSLKVELSQKRIREYEKEGFIKPKRLPGNNNRLYSDFEVEQIKRITYLIHSKGFTLACLKQLLVMAHCWDIFDCPNSASCAAYANPYGLCWKVRRQAGTRCEGECKRCAIFLLTSHKKRRKEKVLIGIGSAKSPEAAVHVTSRRREPNEESAAG